MKLRYLVLLLPLLAVGGCASLGAVGTVLSVNSPNILTPARLQQIHLSYEVFQAAAVSLRKNVPQCTASQTPSPTTLCYKRATYSAIQTIDRQAGSTIANIDAWATSNPTVDASALVDGFTRIINQGTSLLNAANAGQG